MSETTQLPTSDNDIEHCRLADRVLELVLMQARQPPRSQTRQGGSGSMLELLGPPAAEVRLSRPRGAFHTRTRTYE